MHDVAPSMPYSVMQRSTQQVTRKCRIQDSGPSMWIIACRVSLHLLKLRPCCTNSASPCFKGDLKSASRRVMTVVEHLPSQARAVSADQWLSQAGVDPHKSTLGLCWSCVPNKFGYKHQVSPIKVPMFRPICSTATWQANVIL